MICERRVVVQQILTCVFWWVVVRLRRHERQHGWTCPQPPEQNVDVISERVFLLWKRVGSGMWAAREERVLVHSPLPHARFDSVCKRWNLEHVFLDLFSHFIGYKPKVTFGTRVSVRCLDGLSALMLWFLLRLSDCLLCHGSGELFAPSCFPFPQLFDHGHRGRSRGFRHSGGRAATHQVLGSYAILEQ